MSGWHVHSNMSFADSDGYGVSTDNPESDYEIIDNMLKVKDEKKIAEDFRNFLETEAHEFFNTSEWDEDVWEAWRDKLLDVI